MSGTTSDVHVERTEKMIPAHTLTCHVPQAILYALGIICARTTIHISVYISATRVFQHWQQSSRSRARGRRAPKCARCFWPHLRIYVSASLAREKIRALKSPAIGNLWLLRRRGIEINTYTCVRLSKQRNSAADINLCSTWHIIARIFSVHPPPPQVP
jgi:hypothetical protein